MSDLLEITFDELMAPPALPPGAVPTEGYVSARGRSTAPLTAEVLGELTDEDIVLLETSALGTEPTTVKKIRDSHHWLARLLAEGKKDAEASAITGYSVSRISILKSDPAFQEVLQHYRDIREEVFVDVVERFKVLALDATGELQDRLSEEPDGFSNGQLLDVLKAVGDRAGYAPVQKSQTMIGIGIIPSDRLQKLKETVDASSRGRVIRTDKAKIDPGALPSPAPDGDWSEVGEGAQRSPEFRQDSFPDQGQ